MINSGGAYVDQASRLTSKDLRSQSGRLRYIPEAKMRADFGVKISRGLPWLPKIDRSPKLLASIADYFNILRIHECVLIYLCFFWNLDGF